MKRLYYVTQDLDDAEMISKEVHEKGIDDHHFFVVCRDRKGIKTHHLHGSHTLEGTSIVSSRKRAYLLGGVVLGLGIIALTLFSHLFDAAPALPIFLLLGVALLTTFLVNVVGRSFDGYLMGIFDQHLNRGEIIIIIDVARNQAESVETILDRHPKANFIADCSNFGSAIPD